MAGGALAWARALPALDAVEVRRGRELQPSPGNRRAQENAGAGTRMNEL